MSNIIKGNVCKRLAPTYMARQRLQAESKVHDLPEMKLGTIGIGSEQHEDLLNPSLSELAFWMEVEPNEISFRTENHKMEIGRDAKIETIQEETRSLSAGLFESSNLPVSDRSRAERVLKVISPNDGANSSIEDDSILYYDLKNLLLSNENEKSVSDGYQAGFTPAFAINFHCKMHRILLSDLK